MYAAWKNSNPEVVRAFLKWGARIDDRNGYGATPLMWAAENPKPEIIKVLIGAGAKINDKDKEGASPLMHAAWKNHNPEVIKVLLEAGADAKATNNKGKTAYDYGRDNESLRGTDAYRQLQQASQ